MAYCKKCNNNVEDGVRFCSVCGAEMMPQESAPQNNFNQRFSSVNNTPDSTAGFAPADIQQNKAMAILAYIGILVLIPLFAAKDSRFARYHANQGLVLFIVEVIYSVAYFILSFLILSISWRLYFLVSLLGILSIAFLVVAILGIINAANGKAKELPVIGKFRILK